MKRIKKHIVFLMLLISNVNLSMASSAELGQETNYKFTAIYIYSFTKYIEWPGNQLNEKFVIGVYGESPLIDELITLTANRNVKGFPIVVKVVDSEAEARNCNILYLDPNKSDKLNELILSSAKNSFLLVTQGKNLARKGAGINLVTVEGKQKFELNELVVKRSGLKILNELLPLAIIVR